MKGIGPIVSSTGLPNLRKGASALSPAARSADQQVSALITGLPSGVQARLVSTVSSSGIVSTNSATNRNTSRAWSIGQVTMPASTIGSTGYKRYSSDVTTPK